jgi:hypothetical protein
MHKQTGPRRYRIVVRGRLTGPIADGFEHLELESGAGESTLTGGLHDQAQLHGLRRCGYSPESSHTLSSRYSSRPQLRSSSSASDGTPTRKDHP